jgi:hypothetical protein
MSDQSKTQRNYSSRKPNLSEILSGQSRSPWTLDAFIVYLCHNHCLETLQFLDDAKHYRQNYDNLSSISPGGQIALGGEQSAHMKKHWQRLIQTYIQQNGPREVNLPSDVRDGIFLQDISLLPPHPSALNTALENVYELMEESIIVPFLSGLYIKPAQSEFYSPSPENLTHHNSYDKHRHLFSLRSWKRKIRL